MEEVAATPVSAQVVANAFVQQYYEILHHMPRHVHRFYQQMSKLGRPEEDGSMSITSTLEAINEKILSLNYGEVRAEIKSVDAQDSHNGGVHVLVTGCLTGKANILCKFAQTFFLAPQEKGYFVLNDMFRYLDDVNSDEDMVNNVSGPVSDGSALEGPIAEVDNPLEKVDDSAVDVDEVSIPEVVNEVPIPEVNDEVQDNTESVLESSAQIEEAPKKSYASIVMHLKETAPAFSPTPSARKPLQKVAEPVNTLAALSKEEPAMTLESVDNENSHECEADGYSIYVKGLPMNATVLSLEEVFKKFGAIKNDGIQVRSNKGFCFGFVEFEEAISVQKALEASPVLVGGRQAFVEEKKSTNHRGNNKVGRFPPGRSFSFKNDGLRGNGNYGVTRSYYHNKADFNGRNELGARGGSNHGGSSNRNTHQRSNYNRNRSGMANGDAKNMAPRVSATA